MPMSRRTAALEAERRRLLERIAGLEPFRRGSLAVVWRRCGKAGCACVRPPHPGHGPQHLLVFHAPGGRRLSRSLRPGPELRDVRAQIQTGRLFRRLINDLIAVNEALCETGRPLLRRRSTPRRNIL
jgi:uncharacterized protein DUF6788